MPHSKERHYLMHPDSFQTLLSILPEEKLNRMLFETNMIDVGAYTIYQSIYDIAVSNKTKKSQAERLVRSVKQIIKSMNVITCIPDLYIAIAKFGRLNGLGFVDAAHVYVSIRGKLILIVRDKQQAEKLGKYARCIEAANFSGSSMN
jgi:predicted nucleic acid-binding protein